MLSNQYILKDGLVSQLLIRRYRNTVNLTRLLSAKMKSFAKRLLEMQTREQLGNVVEPQSSFPQTTKVQPRLLRQSRQSIEHFQRNFEDLQSTIKMLSRDKLPHSKSLIKRENESPAKQPLTPLERNTIVFTPTRTEREDWVKPTQTVSKFFKGEERQLSKSVVIEKVSPSKRSNQLAQTQKRPLKDESFGSRMTKNTSQVENIPKLGLPNIGNSCYINATVQCLFHLPNFNRIFESEDLQSYLSLKQRGAAIRYAELYRKIRKGSKEDLSTFFLKRAVSKKCSLFLQWNQEDAHQFTQELLDSLHEDLNRITNKPEYRNLEADRKTRGLSSLSTEYWNYYRKRDDSHITDYFCGQILSSVVCCGCAHESLSFDNFLDLSLPMQRGSKSLHELIDNFLQVEELTDPYYCSKCKRYNKSRRKLDIWKTPKLLMIQLKRFKYGKLTKQKIKDKLKFPLQGLNIRQFMNISNDPSAATSLYDLVGVVSHIGNMDGGHYYAHCRDGKKWYKIDDEQVKQIDVKELGFDREGNQFAYILFYSKRDNK